MDDDSPSGYSASTQSTAPWTGQQPYLRTGFERAETDVLDRPIQPYPASTVVPFSGQTESALGMMEERARTGSPLQTGAKTAIQETLEGKYMGENPYFAQAVESATRPMIENYQTNIAPGLSSAFSGAGRYGSGLQNVAQQQGASRLTRDIGDVTAPMAYRDYATERQNMLQAAGMAPGLARTDYEDISTLGRVGGIREAKAGEMLGEDISRYRATQESPQDALSRYMALIGGGYGGETTSEQPIYSDPWGRAIGMGATGAGIAGTLFGQQGIWPA